MVTDFIKGGNQRFRPQRVTHPRPGQPIGLGKGAHTDQARVFDIHRRRSAFGREFNIGLVQNKQCVRWQVFHRGHDIRAFVPCPHRVVRIGQIDQLRPHLGRLTEQGAGVFVVVAIGNLVQHPAKSRDMIIKRGISPVGRDNRIALFDHKPDQIAQQPVNAFADHDVFGANGMMRGQCCAQIMGFRVAIHPLIRRCLLHCGNRTGRRAKDVFIRPKTRLERAIIHTFLCLGADERHGGRKRGNKRGVSRSGHGRQINASRCREQDAKRALTFLWQSVRFRRYCRRMMEEKTWPAYP